MKSAVLSVIFACVCCAATPHAEAQLTYESYYFGTLAHSGGNQPVLSSQLVVEGNVYWADPWNQVIWKMAPTGAINVLAGRIGVSGSADGATNSATFNAPEGLALDGNGNLFVADTLNNVIRKITPDGSVSTYAGLAGTAGSTDGPAAIARFNNPVSLAVDLAGNLYVAEPKNATIRKIDPNGFVSTLAGLAGGSGSQDGVGAAARFREPTSVAVDRNGNVYVADSGNSIIRKITSDGIVTTPAGLAGYGVIAVDGVGSAARFIGANAVGVDAAGNVYICDEHFIRKMTPEGAVTTLGGAHSWDPGDGTGSAATFRDPSAIAVDRTGRIFIADAGGSAIREGLAVQQAGISKTQGASGSFSASVALFGAPSVESRKGSGVGNGDHTLVLSFARNLSSGTATVTSGVGSVAGLPTISGNAMTVNLTGVADAQTLTLTLSGLTDTDGRVIPDTTLPVSFLVGDANGDGAVNSADATLVRNQSGQAVDGTNFRSDLNADGSINSADATIVRARSGVGLRAAVRSLAAAAR